jgi:Ras-related protein Rab-5C
LLANKFDLIEGNEDQAIKREDIEKLAQEYNMQFFYTSAKTGMNLDESFNTLADNILKNNMKDVVAVGE